MSILDQAKEHFSEKLSELLHTEVPEWKTTVYYKTTDNVVQRDKYMPLILESKHAGYVELVMARALDQHGRKLFKPKDREDLMKNIDPEVIISLGTTILGDSKDSDEAAEAIKNSETAS